MKAEVRERVLWDRPKRWEEAPLHLALLCLPEWNRVMKAGASAAILQPGGWNPCLGMAGKKGRMRQPWVPGASVEHHPSPGLPISKLISRCYGQCSVHSSHTGTDWPSLERPLVLGRILIPLPE